MSPRAGAPFPAQRPAWRPSWRPSQRPSQRPSWRPSRYAAVLAVLVAFVLPWLALGDAAGASASSTVRTADGAGVHAWAESGIPSADATSRIRLLRNELDEDGGVDVTEDDHPRRSTRPWACTTGSTGRSRCGRGLKGRATPTATTR